MADIDYDDEVISGGWETETRKRPDEVNEINDVKTIRIPRFAAYRILSPYFGLLSIPPKLQEGCMQGLIFFISKRLRGMESYRSTNLISSMAMAKARTGEVVYARNPDIIYSTDGKIFRNPVEIDEGTYSELKKTGFALTSDEARELRRDSHALPETREAFWKFACEGDTDLLSRYKTEVEKATSRGFDRMMGLGVPNNCGLCLVQLDRVGQGSDAREMDYNNQGFIIYDVIANRRNTTLEEILERQVSCSATLPG